MEISKEVGLEVATFRKVSLGRVAGFLECILLGKIRDYMGFIFSSAC